MYTTADSLEATKHNQTLARVYTGKKSKDHNLLFTIISKKITQQKRKMKVYTRKYILARWCVKHYTDRKLYMCITDSP